MTSLPAGGCTIVAAPARALVLGVVCFLAAYVGFAAAAALGRAPAVLFLLAGTGKGLVETAEQAAVAVHAPEEIRGSAFGVLAAVQSFGNLGASAVAGVLWTLVSPRAAFVYLAGVDGRQPVCRAEHARR